MMLPYTAEGKPTKKMLKDMPSESECEQGDCLNIPTDWWFEDVCMLDMDYFVRTIQAIKARGVKPDMIGAVISNYAMKWLPGLAQEQPISTHLLDAKAREIDDIIENAGSESSTAGSGSGSGSGRGRGSENRRNKFILETLVSILPADKDVVSCSFLLRLLRMAHIVGADTLYKTELERRAGLQLDQASISDLLIPSFSHTSDTLFDVQLVYRIVKGFLSQQDEHTGETALAGRSVGAAEMCNSKLKVAKLLDSYLAEVAHDANLTVSNFEALAEAIPSYVRYSDDGLYRAVDTYLKAHPGISEAERKRLCRLMDCKKLSADACIHAAQNERLPIRTVLQVLFCEHMKLRNTKKFTAALANERVQCPSHGCVKGRCPSRRENDDYDIESLHLELQKIREDFAKLQRCSNLMQLRVDKMSKNRSIFSPLSYGWKKITKSIAGSPQFYSTDRDEQCSVDEFSLAPPRQTQTPVRRKGNWRRNSIS